MNEQCLNIFNSLINWPKNERTEFKRTENNFDFDDFGKYLSALSNKANLCELEFVWLVLGYYGTTRVSLNSVSLL